MLHGKNTCVYIQRQPKLQSQGAAREIPSKFLILELDEVRSFI